MLKKDTYLINVARVLFKLSNLMQPIYYKLRPEIITNYCSFMTILITNYCKIITDYNKKLLQITGVLLQITTVGYYQILKITAKIYYKLRKTVIANYSSSYF